MTVKQVTSVQKWVGLSSDTKPTASTATIDPGAEFYELDTGDNWIWDGTDWVEDLKLFKAMSDALGEFM